MGVGDWKTGLFSMFVFSGVSKGMLLQRKQGQVPKNPLPPS